VTVGGRLPSPIGPAPWALLAPILGLLALIDQGVRGLERLAGVVDRAGGLLGGLLFLAALGGLGATLWQGPELLLRPGPFLFGLAIGWLTYWALRHQQTDGLVRLIGGVVSVAATASTAAAATQGTPVFGASEFALYLQGFAVGFFLYFLTVLACALLAHGTVAAAAAWLIGLGAGPAPAPLGTPAPAPEPSPPAPPSPAPAPVSPLGTPDGPRLPDAP
jgi:hypothetical protein